MDEQIIKFPIEQQEQARHGDADRLLARQVYQDIASFLLRSLAVFDAGLDLNELDECRHHDAILVDGGRGTGKSSVLVNLESYLGSDIYLKQDASHKVDIKDLLILKPVDPTLLENSDDLLLNIIVAALLRNKVVRDKLSEDHDGAEKFYQQLQKLSVALQGVQTHQQKYGMDKLRSFMGNHGLSQEIHLLFKCAAKLTAKKLIVLPIDDVDTSLEHAFANIEVIRKYLGSPYVVPLVSGDLQLYDEVIWRNFHDRLVGEHGREENALTIAKTLSLDYQQKVLPLPRQLRMPTVMDYFNNEHIWLTRQDEPVLPLKHFAHWLEAIVNQQVNGIENSYVTLPVFSTRDLVQLVSITQDEVAKGDLPELISANVCRRLTLMSEDASEVVDDFSQQYNAAASQADTKIRRKGRKQAYDNLARSLSSANNEQPIKIRQQLLKRWNLALMRYVLHKPQGGAIYLITQANAHWLAKNQQQINISSVMDLPLFSPLELPLLKTFEANYSLKNEWLAHQKRDINYFKPLPDKTLLDFPIPDVGSQVGNIYQDYLHQSSSDDSVLELVEFTWSLMQYRSFFKAGKESNHLYVGRLFELLVLSLISEVKVEDIQFILDRPPFYALPSFYRLRALDVQERSTEANELDDQNIDEELLELIEYTQMINAWRKEHLVQTPSAWLVHQMMRKVYSQLEPVYGQKADKSIAGMIKVAYRAFNAIVAACGSFEKSNVFGLGHRVAQQGVNTDPSHFIYTDLYNLNVRPFTELPLGTGSVTRALYHHPLKGMLEELDSFFTEREGKKLKVPAKLKAKQPISEVPIADVIPEVLDDGAKAVVEAAELADEQEPEAFPDYIKNDKRFTALRDKYGEKQLRDFATTAGVVFYNTFIHFRRRNETHGRIRALSKKEFERFSLEQLKHSLLKAKVPQDFIDDMVAGPKRFLCPKVNYRKLVTYLNRHQELGL